MSGVYREFQVVCSQQQPPLTSPSEKTFRQQINRQKNYQLILARQGAKVAKQTKPFHSTDGMPKDGELPWENAHIDHTCLDINLVSSLISLATCNISSAITSEKINLGRCWATLMVDGYSKRILAVYLSFDPPSYRSCLMVIRICVKRFQRLPQTLITDNGKEFQSVYFQQLLAYYKCNHKYRPSGEPRYGSPVERIFGTTNTLWLHELQGNTQILKNKGFFVSPLGAASQFFRYWGSLVYSTNLSSIQSLISAPALAFAEIFSCLLLSIISSMTCLISKTTKLSNVHF